MIVQFKWNVYDEPRNSHILFTNPWTLFQSAISNIANWKYTSKVSADKCKEFGVWYKQYHSMKGMTTHVHSIPIFMYCCFLNESIVRNSPTVSHNLLTMGQLAWIFLVLINTSNYIIFFMCLRCTSYGILHNMRKCTCINNNSFYKYILCLENFNIMSKICS